MKKVIPPNSPTTRDRINKSEKIYRMRIKKVFMRTNSIPKSFFGSLSLVSL